MKIPLVINTTIDTVIAINGDSVINNSTQVKLTAATITVNVSILNLKTNTVSTINSVTMTRNATMDMYTIPIASITSAVTDRASYVANIVESAPAPNNMRSFKIEDFSRDDDSFEAVWMRKPYRITIPGGGNPSYIEWLDGAVVVYRALAYEGGTGTTYATLPERVTHRGPIEVAP